MQRGKNENIESTLQYAESIFISHNSNSKSFINTKPIMFGNELEQLIVLGNFSFF